MSVTDSPLQQSAYDPVAWNFKLLAQHTLDGFGGMGEGMSIQIAPDGRRIIWLAHESAPKNFTAVDVSDPRKPKVVCQTDLPQGYMRSNSLEITDQVMAVAYQCQKVGQKPAGFELFDISKPENPKSIAFVDCSGPFSRGVHQLWFADGEYVHMAVRRGRLRAEPSARRPDLPLLRRAQSVEADRGRPLVAARHPQGRQRAAARAAPEACARQGQPRPQHQCLSAAAGPHVPRLSRRRHVRHGHFRQVEAEADLPVRQLAALYRLHPHHRAAVRSRPGGHDRRVDLRQRRRLAEADLDPRRPRREQPGSDLDLPDAEPGRLQDPRRPLRRAQHPREHAAARRSWQSDQIILGTFFNGGLRAYDISNAYQPKEVATFVPPGPALSKYASIQLNDVFVDEREIVYTVDRFSGGLYILEMDF